MTGRIARLAGVAMLGVLCAGAAGAQPAGRAPRTDRTIDAPRGGRLTVDNFAGEIVLRTWDRDAVRVQARHSARANVSIETTSTGIVVRSEHGADTIDYQISVPVWMPVKARGTHSFISIEGAESEISAETVRGDVLIKGGTGFVTASSIEGEVIVEGASGRINVSSVNEGVQISNASGDIIAETTNGDISLRGVKATSVDVSTVNGEVVYDGAFAERGRYRFATHNGGISLVLPEDTSATFTVRTHQGSFETSLPLQAVGTARRGQRQTFVLGTGSAEVEIESFNGNIEVRPRGTDDAPRGDDLEAAANAAGQTGVRSRRLPERRPPGMRQPALASAA